MPDTEVIEGQPTPQGAAAPITTGVTGVEPVAESTVESPTVTMTQKELDALFGKVRHEERQRTQILEERVRSLETKPAAPPVRVTPTLNDVLTAYDKGQITETVKDQWVHYLSKEDAKREFGGAIAQAAMMARSQSVVAEYVKAYPTLNDMSSKEFQELQHTYNELVAEGNGDSLATQAKALRMTFGPLKRSPMGAASSTSRPDTFVEASGGGGHMARESSDPLKDVSERQKAYWKSRGYTKAQMVEEAQFQGVRTLRDFRKVAGSKKK